MKIRVIPATTLSSGEIRHWSELQQTDPRFASPYFCPEYTLAVASVRDDILVGVIERDTKVVGYFPFQRRGRATGEPVGRAMSNYQGVLVDPLIEWRAEELVRGCGLSAYYFHHLICTQTELIPYHRKVSASPVLDLTSGWESYRALQRRTRPKTFASLERKVRKLERECGPIRFVPHVGDTDHLRQLVEWKREQYRQTRGAGSLSFDWCVEALERILSFQRKEFAGMLSVMYVGEHAVAIHMGMRSQSVWHYWYPSYDRTYAKYSPGLIMLMKMAEWAPSQGIRLIDLGKGLGEHKRELMTGEIAVAEGCVTAASFAGSVRRVGEYAARRVDDWRIVPRLKAALRPLRRLKGSSPI